MDIGKILTIIGWAIVLVVSIISIIAQKNTHNTQWGKPYTFIADIVGFIFVFLGMVL